MKNKHKIKEICGNCLLYNPNKGECRVAVLVEGKEYHMPVLPQDKCHMEELGVEIKQVRWWVEDNRGNPTENGIVKIEYPEGFFKEEV